MSDMPGIVRRRLPAITRKPPTPVIPPPNAYFGGAEAAAVRTATPAHEKTPPSLASRRGPLLFDRAWGTNAWLWDMGLGGQPLRLAELSFRKEVIQPQVPLRLPCYDLVPIRGFVFGACPLAVGPATSDAPPFRGLTGGVYKAQEHIHRGVADLRLLAIPTSRRRVAAFDLNWGVFFGIGSPSRVRIPLCTPL